MGRSSVAKDWRRDDFDSVELMAAEVRAGLTALTPWLPSKYFYDDRGSALFEEITELPEYYQTRTEEAILTAAAEALVAAVRPRELVELGSGAGRKIRTILDAVTKQGLTSRCVMLDINENVVTESTKALALAYPGLEFRAVVGDFTRDLAGLGASPGRLMLFFAGTIGNLRPELVPPFLNRVRAALSNGGAFLVGLDLVKDVALLEAAYNDSAGVTAAFNFNMLANINARLGADFDVAAFEHVAFFDRERSWIEMRVRATRDMVVSIPRCDLVLRLARGDEIRTEISCKYTRRGFTDMLAGTGLTLRRWFSDPDDLFAVALASPGSLP